MQSSVLTGHARLRSSRSVLSGAPTITCICVAYNLNYRDKALLSSLLLTLSYIERPALGQPGDQSGTMQQGHGIYSIPV